MNKMIFRKTHSKAPKPTRIVPQTLSGRVLKKLFDVLWLPLIPITLGGLMWLIGLYNPHPEAVSENDAWGSFSLFLRNGGKALIIDFGPLVVAVSIAVNFASGSQGAAALTVTIGYLAFVGAMAAFMTLWKITPHNVAPDFVAQNFDTTAEVQSTIGFMLGKYVPVAGLISAPLIGIVATLVFNATYQVQMPRVIGFFSGTRFAPIPVVFVCALIGTVYFFSWYIITVYYIQNANL